MEADNIAVILENLSSPGKNRLTKLYLKFPHLLLLRGEILLMYSGVV
jgi:hypothetical protein